MSKENSVSDERLAEMLIEVKDEMESAIADAEYDQNPQLAIDAVGEFDLSEMHSILAELQSLRSKPVAGVEVKPLVWNDTREETLSRLQVASVSYAGVCNFSYEIYRNADGTFEAVYPGSFGLPVATLAEAKAVAEDNYRQRIFNALPTHKPLQEEG